jgi:hypothetical protein
MDKDSDAILAGPPVAGNELDTLLGALERQRGYVAWKCGNLDSAGLSARLEPSTMTLGGLLKHLALVEDDWFSVKLHGKDPHPPWNSVDWDADPDWDWHSAGQDSPQQLLTLWQDATDRSRALVAEAIATAKPRTQSATFSCSSVATMLPTTSRGARWRWFSRPTIWCLRPTAREGRTW